MTDPTAQALVDACSQPGCPVCTVVRRVVTSYLRSVMYESVNDVPLRLHLRESLGFCNHHNWQLLNTDIGNALGVAIIYNDVLKAIRRELPPAGAAETGSNGLPGLLRRFSGRMTEKAQTVLQALNPLKPCPACVQQLDAEQVTIKVLVQSLGDEDFRQAISQSQGLCVPHMRVVFPAIGRPEDFDFLLGLQVERLSALNEELAEFIRKNDYRFQHEGFGLERDAWRRVIAVVAGKPENEC